MEVSAKISIEEIKNKVEANGNLLIRIEAIPFLSSWAKIQSDSCLGEIPSVESYSDIYFF